MIAKFFLSILAIFLFLTIVRSLKLGVVQWYGGEAFSARRSIEPGAYWLMIAIEVSTLLFLIWAVVL